MTRDGQDPALPVEDQQAAAAAPSDTIEVDDLDQFVKLLTRWHGGVIKRLEHYLQMKDDPEAAIVMQVGDGPEVKLEGDVLTGLKAGIQLALMDFGKLPFGYQEEPETPAQPDAAATPA